MNLIILSLKLSPSTINGYYSKNAELFKTEYKNYIPDEIDELKDKIENVYKNNMKIAIYPRGSSRIAGNLHMFYIIYDFMIKDKLH